MADFVYALIVAEMMHVGDYAGAERVQPCSSNECIRVAQWTCHWPGQTGVKCHKCRAKLAAIAEAMGFTLQATALDVVLGASDGHKRAALLELE